MPVSLQELAPQFCFQLLALGAGCVSDHMTLAVSYLPVSFPCGTSEGPREQCPQWLLRSLQFLPWPFHPSLGPRG